MRLPQVSVLKPLCMPLPQRPQTTPPHAPPPPRSHGPPACPTSHSHTLTCTAHTQLISIRGLDSHGGVLAIL